MNSAWRQPTTEAPLIFLTLRQVDILASHIHLFQYHSCWIRVFD